MIESHRVPVAFCINIPVSERTMYRCIESGILTIGNMDLTL